MEPDSPFVQESATLESPSAEPQPVPPDVRLQLEGALGPDIETAPSGRAAILRRIGVEAVAWLKTLASAAVYAVLIVTFGVQVARVEGQSMAPTLANQDRLIVNKFTYQFCISIPPVHLGCRDPRPSDIVMLYYPVDPDKSFVKRVIAEAGDTVRISDGRVFVNGLPVSDEYVAPDYRSHENHGPENPLPGLEADGVVPEGYYFVMGDHRNNSSDSRHWGFVPKKYIIGRVQLRWWPILQARVF